MCTFLLLAPAGLEGLEASSCIGCDLGPGCSVSHCYNSCEQVEANCSCCGGCECGRCEWCRRGESGSEWCGDVRVGVSVSGVGM